MGNDTLMKLEKFFSGFTKIVYKKGETILRPEDNPSGVYFIKRGFVKNYSVSEGGKEITLNIFKPGSYFPMSWAMTGAKNLFFYEAITPVIIHRAPKPKVLSFLETEPKILLNLTCRILTGLEGTLNRMHYILSGDAHKRIFSTIYVLAKRFGEKKDRDVVINLPVTHLSIASLSGLTRETTSVIMRQIAKEGIISYRNKQITIKRMRKLEALTSVLQS